MLQLLIVLALACTETKKEKPCCDENTTTETSTTTETTTNTNSIMLEAVPCDSAQVELPDGWLEPLTNAGLTQCVTPFGIIIAAAGDVPASYINTAAKITAELIDPDMDGVANDPIVMGLLAEGRHVWLPMPSNEESWMSGVEETLSQQLPAYGIMIPEWWMGSFSSSGPDSHAKAVMVEEIFHAFTQFGYSIAYPDIFGVESWNSLIAQETQRAQCDWWQHPENDCPGSPSQGGDCSDPSCDITEFYHQVAVLRAGMEPAWYGIGFPRTRDELEEKLSDELKAAMDNPLHYQLSRPLTFQYGD